VAVVVVNTVRELRVRAVLVAVVLALQMEQLAVGLERQILAVVAVVLQCLLRVKLALLVAQA
jgi:hypothetical protein